MLLIKGMIMISLAILIIMLPADALRASVLYLGIGLTLAGMVRIVQSIYATGVVDNWRWILILGVIDITAGLILMINPLVSLEVLPFIIGFWATFYGLYTVIDAFSGPERRGIKIFAGILTIIIGSMIMYNPVMMGMTMAIWIGILLLIVGIFNVIASFSLK